MLRFCPRVRPRQRVVAAVLVLGTTAAVQGCSAVSRPRAEVSSSVVSGSLPEEVRAAGVLRVATDPTYPPFESLSADQRTIVGLDPDLLNAIGEMLGVRIELVRVGFDSIIPGLQAGRFDLAVSGMTDTAERRSQVTFVDYFNAGGAIVQDAGAAATPAEIRSRLCGAKVGVQTGTITIGLAEKASAACRSAGRAPIDIQRFPSVPASMLAMGSGRVDFVWTDSVNAAAFVKEGAGRFSSVDDGTPPYPTGMAFRKDSRDLAAAVQGALQELIDDGTYQRILAGYDLSGGAVKKAEINGDDN